MRSSAERLAKRRKIWAKLLLLVMGLAAGLALSELLLRAAGVAYPLPYAPDRHCGTRLMPGFSGWWQKEGRAHIRINRFGFRHGDRGPEKPPHAMRVAVLGDSFIEAFQVPDEQTLCHVVERELAGCEAICSNVVEVLNFGVSGYGTAQQLQMLQHYVWDYKPDVVVLAFFPGNDLRNNSRDLEPYQVRPFYRLVDGQLVLDDSFLRHPDYLKAHSASVRWKVRLINHSRLLQLVNEIRSQRAQVAGPAPGALGAGIDAVAWTEPTEPLLREAWEVTEQLIIAVHQACQRHEVPLLLLVIGCHADLHPDAESGEQMRRELDADDLRYPERRLLELGRQQGFAVLGLAEPMSRYAQQHQQYLHGFPDAHLGAGHWNEAGNRLAGQLTARAICDLLSPP
jgi:lysophospholipase L1-like esterase